MKPVTVRIKHEYRQGQVRVTAYSRAGRSRYRIVAQEEGSREDIGRLLRSPEGWARFGLREKQNREHE